MFSLPSSQRLVTPALLFFIIVASIRLYLRLTDLFRTDIFHYIVIESSSRSSHDFTFEAALSPSLPLQDRFLEQYHSSTRKLPPNPHVVRVFSQCNHRPNPHTGHVRLSNIPLLNISVVPSAAGESGDEFNNNKYFNPAIIPLPSYVSASPSTPYQYLLISRLVTTGTHQESHICFANICTPSDSLSHSSPCTDDDISLLGPAGGMRCVTKPERINIPSTPAKRCASTWKVFPDLPGFHDPRVFWSGRGEPLIEVNSGSVYGCIGLWMQDLRSVFEPLRTLLGRKLHGEKGEEEEEKNKEKQEQEKQSQVMDVGILRVNVGYPTLTELTRNPRGSRGQVEKNWIVFFPSEDEMWVQYNAMGKAVREEQESEQAAVKLADVTELSSSGMEVTESSMVEGSTTTDPDKILEEFGLLKPSTRNDSKTQAKRLERYDSVSKFDTNAVNHLNLTAPSHKLIPRNISQSAPPAGSEVILPNNSGSNLQSRPQPQSYPTQTPGRTLSQLFSHALTTKNLTSPHEPPCFLINSRTHITDSLNNTGHWHQGTNCLRLILCTRSSFRTRTCIPSTPLTPSDITTYSPLQHEEYLRSEGAIVHFSIVHRKFSNKIDLPMRYERYVLVWEARAPYRVVAVSKYPFVFGSERVRPWSYEQDISDQDRDQHQSFSGTRLRRAANLDLKTNDDSNPHEPSLEEDTAYFTYTPSLAWSHRSDREDEHIHRRRGHEDLGTGYLDDEVIVGIGMNDVAQGFLRVGVGELLGCLRVCEGV